MEKVTFRIYRGKETREYWEEFELPLEGGMNVISALMEIQKSPVNKKGEKVEPVTWEQGCLEEVCGSCSMLINGKPRQACTAIISDIITRTGSSTITLAPLSKFPRVRDLVVNRDQMFSTLKNVHGWVEVDGTFIKGFGPKVTQQTQDTMYTLSTCMTCGCCTESCPQFHEKSKFVGPAAISQVRYFNLNPTGKMSQEKRLHQLMDEGGISECGNAQNCVQVCPKEIPLTESIAVVGREVTSQAVRDIFGTHDKD